MSDKPNSDEPEWANLLDHLFLSESPALVRHSKDPPNYDIPELFAESVDVEENSPAFRLDSLNLIEENPDLEANWFFGNTTGDRITPRSSVMVLSERGLRIASERASRERNETLIEEQISQQEAQSSSLAEQVVSSKYATYGSLVLIFAIAAGNAATILPVESILEKVLLALVTASFLVAIGLIWRLKTRLET